MVERQMLMCPVRCCFVFHHSCHCRNPLSHSTESNNFMTEYVVTRW